MTQISQEDLPKIRRKHKKKKIIYSSGCFDLLHAGHILFLEDCKKLGDILVVGIGGDRAIRDYKGSSRPILNEHIRTKMIDALSCVDYCFIDDNYKIDDDTYGIEVALKLLKPDVYIFNEDAYKLEERKLLGEKYGVEIKILKRWCPAEYENISTSKIIDKIRKS